LHYIAVYQSKNLKGVFMRFFLFFGTLCLSLTTAWSASLIDLTNHQSGISVSLSGTNGTDWAVERTFHNDSLADQYLYVKSTVDFSLAHNANNTLVNIYAPNRLIGANGLDNTPNSGDEGILHYKIDRDQQCHAYTGTLASWLPVYSTPFRFATLTYDGTLPVLGTTGVCDSAWSGSPRSNTQRFYYGMNDAFGNEWHVLTYWDDDVTLLTNASINVHRQGASDGHCLAVCVNPVTPVLQFKATGTDQFYTTPAKTYHVPKIWDQTTYLTAGVQVNFVNITDAQIIQYRVDSGTYQDFSGTPLVASALFSGANTTHVLEYKCGAAGVVARRTIVYQPDYPALSEHHGYMFWADNTEKQAAIQRIKNVSPFKNSYQIFTGSYYQGSTAVYTDARLGWCDGAGVAGAACANAFKTVVDGVSASLTEAKLGKARLLRLAKQEAVGTDIDINSHSPAKDYLNELGQTIQGYAGSALAYDLLASCFRQTNHVDGITPVEEHRIRDGLAEVASVVLGRMHENYSASVGGGDTHWSHGYELMIGITALAMPTYKTPYYGVSGGDRATLNNQAGTDGKYWNPFPDQAVTWYQVATDPFVATPGFPGLSFPFRAEFLLSDDGWWTGPNDFMGDGDRYFSGPAGDRLVDINYGGLANAECRNELVEMDGYESPFVSNLYMFDCIRRNKGDFSAARSVQTYMRRRLVNGVVYLSWNATDKTYSAQAPRVETAIYGFNKHFDFAGIPSSRRLIGKFLNDLNIYYGVTSGTLDSVTRARLDNDRKLFYGVSGLALCADTASIPVNSALPVLPPIVKPLMKHVVKPGEAIWKDIVAIDLNGAPLTVTVSNLPAGAVYDSAARRITWTPQAADAGVHIATISATNGQFTTTRPFPMIVKSTSGPVLSDSPSALTAQLAEGDTAVRLTWTAPATGPVHSYFIYRDGIFQTALPAGTLTYIDRENIPPRSHIRYWISYVNTSGGESNAASATPGYITIPARVVGILDHPLPLAKGQRITVWPNPFTQSLQLQGTDQKATPALVKIYNSQGTCIRTLHGVQAPIVWDGMDAQNRIAPAGIYLCRVQADGAERTIRVIKTE
jgi:hypothetical protein